MPGPGAFVQGTATAAGTKDRVPGGAAAVAPVGGVSVAPAEDAAPGGDAGRATAGGRTGAEIRDGSLSGTVGRERKKRTSDELKPEKLQVLTCSRVVGEEMFTL